MVNSKLLYYLIPFLIAASQLQAQAPAIGEYMTQAAYLRKQPVSEDRFRKTCDLAQAAALLSLDSGYHIIRAYLPLVKTNPDWTYILLMGWAKAEMALGEYTRADSIYRLVRTTWPDNTRQFREAAVASILLWTEYEQPDSLAKYFTTWEKLSKESGDNENLSFLYCFRTMNFYLAGQTDSVKYYFDKAIKLAASVPDRNALFTAKYNYANLYLRNDPQQQVAVFTELWELSKDSSLARYPPKLYERTAFSFRNAGPSVSYQLMQLNLLLTDYNAAGNFAQEFYNATVIPSPTSGQAPLFNAEMAIVKCYQQDWQAAEQFLHKSKQGFGKPDSNIRYPGYFIASAMLAEHAGEPVKQLGYMQAAMKRGGSVGLYVLPIDLYYIHALIANGKLEEAERTFKHLPSFIKEQRYAAPGLFYYKYYAELKKAKGQLHDYVTSLETYYQIKDSLLNFNRYRTIQETLTRMRVREQQQKIVHLNEQQEQMKNDIRKERYFYILLFILFISTIILLILFLRLRQAKMNQQVQLQRFREMQHVMNAEEKQRAEIAAELHNEVNSLLSLSILNISSELERNPDRQGLQKSLDNLTIVGQSIRNLSHRLDSSVLAVKDFRRAVLDMSELVNMAGKVHLETILVGFNEREKHSFTLLSDIYAILQELLQNIIRHAKAKQALLEIVEHEDRFTIMVEDDGIGIEEQKDGLGLKTIRNKVKEWNGSMEISRGAEGGTLIVIEVPVK